MLKKAFWISLVLILASGLWVGFLLPCFSQGTEKLTITTYYPSPFGVYKTLRIYPNDDNTPGGACTSEGEMYYDASDHDLYICSGSTLTWKPAGGGYWAASSTSSNDIYNTNTGNVGIGTTSPQAKLHVNGEIIGRLSCRAIPREDKQSYATCSADEYELMKWCSGDCNDDDAKVTICCKAP